MAVERQSATLPPPQPSAILRGHASQIHSVQFVRQNSRLLSGDAEGYVVYWQVETQRPLAVWKAHAGPILGFAEWSHDKIITHGRDNTLRVWQIRPEDETGLNGPLSRTLPVDVQGRDLPKPWLKYAMPVNTLNFCSFSMCYQHPPHNEHAVAKGREHAPSIPESDPVLVAVPATNDKRIDVYRLPGEQLKVKTLPAQVRSEEPGMVMAVKLVRHQTSQNILLLAGYDGGITAAFKLPGNCTGFATETAQLIYLSQPHSQPILSLDALTDGSCYFTSSADAVIAMHRIPELPSRDEEQNSTPVSQPMITVQSPYKMVDTKHAGQQSLRVRCDGRLLVTGGWDTRIRIYSTKTLKEVAVLKRHKEGVYAVAFNDILTVDDVRRKEGHGDGVKIRAQRQRDEATKLKHYVAAGAKDGKVSLWEVF